MKTEQFEQFYYPKGYYDFSDGVPIDETTINIWIQRAFDKIALDIKETPDLDKFFHTISSGNTKVLVEAYRQNGDKFTIYVSVSTCYKQKTGMDIKLY